MSKDSGKIERAAVRAVEQLIDNCPKLAPNITKNDKTPIWDGEVYVYSSSNHTVDDFFSRIPLQIKGRSVEELEETATYYIERKYIEKYKNDGGCLFFLVLEQDSYYQIFYKLLGLADLRLLLNSNKKYIKIALESVPRDTSLFESKVLHFSVERNNEKIEIIKSNLLNEINSDLALLSKSPIQLKDKTKKFTLESNLLTLRNLVFDNTIGWRERFVFYVEQVFEILDTESDVALLLIHLKSNFAKFLLDQRLYTSAERHFRNALISTRLPNNNASIDIQNLEGKILTHLGDIHTDTNLYNEAEDDYQQSLSIRRKCLDNDNDKSFYDLAETLNNIAILHSKQNLFEKAEPEYNEALSIYRFLSTRNHNNYKIYEAVTLNNLGILHDDVFEYDKAELEYREAIMIIKENVPNDSEVFCRYLAHVQSNLANLLNKAKRFEEAEIEFLDAEKIRSEIAESNADAYNGDYGETLTNYANLLYMVHRYSEAECKYKLALEKFEEISSNDPYEYIGIIALLNFNLSVLYATINEKDNAIKHAHDSWRQYQLMAKNSPNLWREDCADGAILLNKIMNNSFNQDLLIDINLKKKSFDKYIWRIDKLNVSWKT